MHKRIRYFLAVANTLSFTVAAEQMYITQQAMTRQISLLEEELGVKLFTRSTRSVQLTQAGRICRDEFSRLEGDFDAALQRVRNAAFDNPSVVNIGFYYFFSRSRIITPIMEMLYARFPDVTFRISLHDFRYLRQNLLDGNIDLCVAVSSDWQYWTSLKVTALRPQPFKLLVSAGHPLAAHEELPLEALAEHIWLASTNLDILRPYASGWSRRIPSKAKIPVGDFMTVLAYVEAGQGFSCQPPVYQGVESPAIKHFPLPFPDAVLDYVCAHRSDMLNPLVLSVAGQLKRHFPVEAL